MIIGNIVLSRENPAKECVLIKERKLKKLSAYMEKYRFSEEAEKLLTENFADLEEFVAAYLKKYGCFINNECNLTLVSKFELADDFYSALNAKFLACDEQEISNFLIKWLKLLYQEKKCATNFAMIYNLIVAKSKQEVFLKELLNLSVEEIEFFLLFNDISVKYQKILCVSKEWRLISYYITHHNCFTFDSSESLSEFLMVASTSVITKFFRENNSEVTGRFSAIVKTKNIDAIEACFDQVKKETCSFADFDILARLNLKSLDRNISKLDMNFEEEVILLNPENLGLAIYYASLQRFKHKQNEFAFLKLFKQYPDVVKDYANRYNGSFSLSKDEEMELFDIGAGELLNRKNCSPAILIKYVLPEICKHKRKLDDNELMALIEQSSQNPQLLKNWLAQKGNYLTEEMAVRLFFYGDEELASAYSLKNGFNFAKMINFSRLSPEFNSYKIAIDSYNEVLKHMNRRGKFSFSFHDEKNYALCVDHRVYGVISANDFDAISIMEKKLSPARIEVESFYRLDNNAHYQNLIDLCFAIAKQNRLMV